MQDSGETMATAPLASTSQRLGLKYLHGKPFSKFIKRDMLDMEDNKIF